jgi:uncharacterized protein (DUF1697 family)
MNPNGTVDESEQSGNALTTKEDIMDQQLIRRLETQATVLRTGNSLYSKYFAKQYRTGLSDGILHGNSGSKRLRNPRNVV